MKELQDTILEALRPKPLGKYGKLTMRVDGRPNTKEDFERYSGTTLEKAIEYLKMFFDEFKNVKMTADLFYSGYAGWALYDENDEVFAYLLYDSNRYGLEDAHQGSGWYIKAANASHSPLTRLYGKMKDVVKKLAYFEKPDKVRM